MRDNRSKYVEGPAIRRHGLSLREVEVLNHVAEGKTNLEISSILGISERTVEKHLERVYKKLGVGCRTSAALFYINNNYMKELQKPQITLRQSQGERRSN